MQLVRLGGGTGPGSKFGTEAIVDSQRGSLRASINPLDYTDINGNVLGWYRASTSTGTTVSIGANGILFYMRWSDTSRLAVVTRVQVSQTIAASVTTAVAVDAGLFISRGSTAAGSGGGAVTISGNSNKMRGTMSSSLVSDMGIATTGALTRPTTGTVDSNAIASTTFHSAWNIQQPGTATFNNQSQDVAFDLYKWEPCEHPIVLAGGDTLELQEITAGPVTGGIRFYVTVSWAELATF